MAVLVRSRRWSGTPPTAAQVDRSHPLAQQLKTCFVMTERAGLPRDMRGVSGAAFDGTPVWATTPGGVGLVTTGGSGVHSLDTSYNISAADFTVRVLHRPNSWGAFTALFEKGVSSSGLDTARELSIFCSATAVSFLVIGQSSQSSPFTVAQTVGKVCDLVMVRRNGNLTLYLNGVQQGTALSAAVGAVSGSSVYLGKNISGGGTHYDGTYYGAQLWTRALTADEVQRLAAHPHAFLQAPAARQWASAVTPAASGTGSLTLGATATAAAPLTATAALTLTTAGTGAAPLTAAGTVTLTAAGTARAATTGTAALVLTGTATGSVPSSSTGSLTLQAVGAAAVRAVASASLTLRGSAVGSLARNITLISSRVASRWSSSRLGSRFTSRQLP